MGQKGSKESSEPRTIITERQQSPRNRKASSEFQRTPSRPMTQGQSTASHQPPPPPLRSTNEAMYTSPSYTSSHANRERTGTSNGVPSHHKPSSSSASSSTTAANNSLDKFFTKYKDDKEDAILAAGMEQFCEDLGVNPTDLIVLIIAWKFQASEMCRFTREEFINGCQRLKVSDAKMLKQRFPELIQEVQQSEKSFKDLYNFTFTFGLDHASGQRSLPVEMAAALWELVFTFKKPPLLDRWLSFVTSNAPHGISRDTWNMFLPFVNVIKPDLSNYDESEAWPSLFDDFVEMEQTKQ